MAGLLDTLILNFRADSNLDKYENKQSSYGALRIYQDQTEQPGNILSPELIDRARDSVGAPKIETPVLAHDGTSGLISGGARTVLLPDYENTSHMVEFKFVPYSFAFSMYEAEYKNNEIKYQRDFNFKLEKMLLDLATALDKAAAANLALNRTTVCNNPLAYAWTTANKEYYLQATSANQDYILGDINPIFAANDFYGNINLVGNTSMVSMVRHLMEYGMYNSIDKQLEWTDKRLYVTNNAGAGDTTNSMYFYAVQDASLGCMSRVERDAIMGTRLSDGHQWGTQFLPIVNMEMGTYSYDEAVNATASIGGANVADLTRTGVTRYGFATEVCFVTAYVSDYSQTTAGQLPSPIMQIAVKK